MRAQVAGISDEPGDSSALFVEDAIDAALKELATGGVADPMVVLAAGEHCAVELDAFIDCCRKSHRRVRIGDSLRMEPSRLLQASARDRPAGLDARLIASAGDAAWPQACELVVAALDAGEKRGAIAGAVRADVIYAFAIFDGAHAPASTAGAAGIPWLCHTLDAALAASNTASSSRAPHRGEVHIGIAGTEDERLYRRRRR